MAQIEGAWVQARNWEMMAFGLVERGQKWGHSFYNHSYRSRTRILAPTTSLTASGPSPPERTGEKHNVFRDSEGPGLVGQNLGSFRELGWGGGSSSKGL